MMFALNQILFWRIKYYCIKVISNNTLYEANLEYEGEGGNNKERNEMQMLVGAYTKAPHNQDDKNNKPTINISPAIPSSDVDSARKYAVTTDKIEDMLKVNIDGRDELNKIDTFDFNVFKIQ